MRSFGFSALRALLFSVAFGAAALLSNRASAADYGDVGALPTLTSEIKGVDGLTGRVTYPNTDTDITYPVVVLAHGFLSGPENMVGWSEHLASHGFVAVALRNCGSGAICTPDPAAEAALVKKALAYVAGGISPEKVSKHADPSRFVLLGHSAGGQAVTVAAAALSPTALVLFDPVGGGQSSTDFEPAKSALGAVCSPTLTVYAEPHETGTGPFTQPSCNKTGAWQTFGQASTGPRVSLVVKGSTHCDGESPPRGTCGFACGGGAEAARQKIYRRYATAFSLAYASGDAAAAESLVAAKIAADGAVEKSSVQDGALCSPAGGGAGGAAGGGGNAGGNAGGEAGGAAGTGGDEGGAAGAAVGSAGAAGKPASAAAGAAGKSGGAGGAGPTGGTTGAPPMAGAGGAAAGGAGGATLSGGAAGVPRGGAAGAAGTAGGNELLEVGESESGCGCRTAPPSRASATAALFGLAAGAVAYRRRRTRRS